MPCRDAADIGCLLPRDAALGCLAQHLFPRHGLGLLGQPLLASSHPRRVIGRPRKADIYGCLCCGHLGCSLHAARVFLPALRRNAILPAVPLIPSASRRRPRHAGFLLLLLLLALAPPAW